MECHASLRARKGLLGNTEALCPLSSCYRGLSEVPVVNLGVPRELVIYAVQRSALESDLLAKPRGEKGSNGACKTPQPSSSVRGQKYLKLAKQLGSRPLLWVAGPSDRSSAVLRVGGFNILGK